MTIDPQIIWQYARFDDLRRPLAGDLLENLSAAERAELDRWRNLERREEWILARALARQLVAVHFMVEAADEGSLEICSRDSLGRGVRPARDDRRTSPQLVPFRSRTPGRPRWSQCQRRPASRSAPIWCKRRRWARAFARLGSTNTSAAAPRATMRWRRADCGPPRKPFTRPPIRMIRSHHGRYAFAEAMTANISVRIAALNSAIVARSPPGNATTTWPPLPL